MKWPRRLNRLLLNLATAGGRGDRNLGRGGCNLLERATDSTAGCSALQEHLQGEQRGHDTEKCGRSPHMLECFLRGKDGEQWRQDDSPDRAPGPRAEPHQLFA